MKEYGLYRGPSPEHIRTYEEILDEAYFLNWLHDNVEIGPAEFVGRMPIREDLQVEPLPDGAVGVSGFFVGWENPEFTIRIIKQSWWSKLLWRARLFLFGPPPAPPSEGFRLI